MDGRLAKLESGSGKAKERCPECGLRPEDRRYTVVHGVVEHDHAPDASLPEVCPACGRYTRTFINVVYDGEPLEKSVGS